MTDSIVPSNFVRFDADGLELIVETSTGKAYASISAASRMLGIDRTTVSKKLTRENKDVISAEIETVTGLKPVNLIDSETLYDMALDYNRTLAKKMGAAGANVYMLGLAGYSVEVKPSVPQDYAAALRAAADEYDRRLIAEELAKRQQLEIEMLSEENEQLAEAVDELFNYSSIVRIAKYNNCDEKNFSWRSLKMASRLAGTEVKKVPCPRYGEKNLYSHEAWREAYPKINLPETNIVRISQAIA